MSKLMRWLLVLALSLCAAPAQASLDFDPTDDVVSCGSAASLDNIWAGGGTVCLRFQRDRLTSYEALVTKINPSTFQGWAMGFGDDGGTGDFDSVYFFHSSNSTATGWEGFGTGFVMDSTTAYYNLCMAYNKDNVSNAPTGAINGTVLSFSGSGATVSMDSDAAETWTFSDAGSPFDGTILEAYVWTSALTTTQMAEITSNFTRRAALAIDTANIVGYWPMDDQTGGSAADGDTVNDISEIGGDCTASDGANNTGMIWGWEANYSYP